MRDKADWSDVGSRNDHEDVVTDDQKPKPVRPIIHNRKEDDRELLVRALDTLHAIGSVYSARKLLRRPNILAAIRVKLEKDALTDKQIEELALDTWEQIVVELQKR